MKQIKKYIRGNSKRGKDVIAELEKLGGKNYYLHGGTIEECIYFFDKHNSNKIVYENKGSLLYDFITEHWEEIKLPEQFKDGDIAVTKEGYIHLLRTKDSSYCAYRESWKGLPKFDHTRTTQVKVVRLATEEEKEKLFKAIKDNGYKWNAETKTLEKLIVPKFRIGDRIKHKLTGDVCKVLFVLSNGYGGGVYDVAITNEIGKSIDIKEQDEYELLPNKFDITTLKPFDKVLVRDIKEQVWVAGLFSHTVNRPLGGYTFACIGYYPNQCIPYEENKHLLGTTNDCPDFYKTWEE